MRWNDSDGSVKEVHLSYDSSGKAFYSPADALNDWQSSATVPNQPSDLNKVKHLQ